MLQRQLQKYCLLSSIATLLAYVVGFDRVALALTPLSTLCVMLLPKATIDAIEGIQYLLKNLELIRLQNLRRSESLRVRELRVELEGLWRTVCPDQASV